MRDDESLVISKTELEKRLGTKSGSLRELVKKADADGALLLLDCSGSMGAVLATGERAIDALRQVVADVRANVKVPAAQFGAGPVCEVDQIPEPCGGTPLHDAIRYGRETKKSHLVVISDGMPDSTVAAMDEAKKFGGKIDAIYVGDDGSPGAKFMAELAAVTGGTGSVEDLKQAKQLVGKVIGLLGDGQPAPQKGPILL